MMTTHRSNSGQGRKKVQVKFLRHKMFLFIYFLIMIIKDIYDVPDLSKNMTALGFFFFHIILTSPFSILKTVTLRFTVLL